MTFQLEAKPTNAAQRKRTARPSLHLGGAPYQPRPEDPRPRRLAITFAVVLHVLLFAFTWPNLRAKPLASPAKQQAYVVQQVRFQPPPPKKAQVIPRKKAKRIPIPDPTPDEPEPIYEEEVVDLPEIEIDGFANSFVIPDGPPSQAPEGVRYIEGDIIPPKKLFSPQPRYTEAARQARVQGVVILQTIVDALGNIDNVKVLKGLPEGLAEEAVQTVQTWRYEPALLHGEPVPVYMNLTVSFSLQ